MSAVVNAKDNLIWVAYCIPCGKAIYEGANGVMIEAAAQHHANETEHTTMVCYQVEPDQAEEDQ